MIFSIKFRMKNGVGLNKIRVLTAFSMLILITSLPITFASEVNQTLTYDANGNLITGDGKYREYNEFNQLIRVREGNSSSGERLEEYVYHPTEDRILAKKVYSGGNSPDEYVVYVNDNFVRSATNLGGTARVNDTYYVFDDMGMVGQKIANGTTPSTGGFTQRERLFYQGDHLSSTSLITNSLSLKTSFAIFIMLIFSILASQKLIFKFLLFFVKLNIA